MEIVIDKKVTLSIKKMKDGRFVLSCENGFLDSEHEMFTGIVISDDQETFTVADSDELFKSIFNDDESQR